MQKQDQTAGKAPLDSAKAGTIPLKDKLSQECCSASPNQPDARAGQAHTQSQHPSEPGRGEIPDLDAEAQAQQQGQTSTEAANQLAGGKRGPAEQGTP